MKMYTKRAVSSAQYAHMRGVTDFSNAAQFNLYEKGYAHLFVINFPKYIEKISEMDATVGAMAETFKHILENEFKGLDGIDDITVESLEVTDNISTMNVIGKVVKQSAAEVTMNFTEKSGSIITNFLRYYLEGIKDPRTQAKTYHGLIKGGILAGGFENEVFNFMYVVTDNTMLQIEKAYLLCNAWPTKAPTNIYNSTKGEIEKVDVDLTFNCFVIDGPDVDKHALQILAAVNENDVKSDELLKNSNANIGSDNAVVNAFNKTNNDSYNGMKLDETGFLNNINASAEADDIIHLQYDEVQGETNTDGKAFQYDILKDGEAVKTYINNKSTYNPNKNASAAKK